MKATIFKLILLLIISSTITSCNSNDDDNGFTPTLPPITQTGENTFGCLVDGEVLIPRDGSGTYLGADKGMDYWGSTNNIYNEIRARDFKTGNWGIIDIHIDNLFENGVGNYIIKDSNCERLSYANQNVNIRCRWIDANTQELEWFCSIDNSGELIITKYDFENRILSGTFSCSAVNRDNPNDIIEITEGRFDLKWDTLPYTNFP